MQVTSRCSPSRLSDTQNSAPLFCFGKAGGSGAWAITLGLMTAERAQRVIQVVDAKPFWDTDIF